MNKYIYMAGLMDGEGTIGIARNNATVLFKSPYISVSSTTMAIHMWLQNNFGGHTSVQKTYKENHKQAWSWKLKNLPQIYDLLEGILPYMLEPDKRRRAELILWEYPQVTKRNGKYTPEERRVKEYFEERFFDPLSFDLVE